MRILNSTSIITVKSADNMANQCSPRIVEVSNPRCIEVNGVKANMIVLHYWQPNLVA